MPRVVSAVLALVATTHGALLQPVDVGRDVSRRGAIAAAFAAAVPLAAVASPGSYIVGSEEQKFKSAEDCDRTRHCE